MVVVGVVVVVLDVHVLFLTSPQSLHFLQALFCDQIVGFGALISVLVYCLQLLSDKVSTHYTQREGVSVQALCVCVNGVCKSCVCVSFVCVCKRCV